ncbi:MAG: SMC-Scp complex subunit ScpB [Phycisphaerales bacterium JB043]
MTTMTAIEEVTSRAMPPDVPDDLAQRVEAMLVSASRPCTAGAIAQALGLRAEDDAVARVESVIEMLNEEYEQTGRSFRVTRVAGGYRVMTLARFASDIVSMLGARESSKLSKAALETLAIVAYQQPVTRARLEAIRGVACGEVLRSLIEKKLLAIAGRAEEPGRPLLYATSKRFLEVFGLASIRDLPRIDELPTGESE